MSTLILGGDRVLIRFTNNTKIAKDKRIAYILYQILMHYSMRFSHFY